MNVKRPGKCWKTANSCLRLMTSAAAVEWVSGNLNFQVIVCIGRHSIFGLPVTAPSLDWLESVRHEEDRGLSAAAIQQALATGNPYFCQYRIVFQGKTIWIEDHGTIHYTDDGQPERIIGPLRISPGGKLQKRLCRRVGPDCAPSAASLIWSG